MHPFWSVVVPLYNRTQYLAQCLSSVLDQHTDPADMEILVVDDASPVDMSGMVEAAGRGRVSYQRNATNLGLYPSLNLALQQTRGQWLHILHDDDWVLPGFYATMQRAAEASPESVGVVFCQYRNHQPDGTTWMPRPFRDGPGLMDRQRWLLRLGVANSLNQPAVVYRRQAFESVGAFREDLPYTADWEWYVRAACQLDWWHVPEVLACWRVHAGSQTNDLARRGMLAQDVWRTLEIFARVLPRDIAPRVLLAARQVHARNLAQGNYLR